MIFNPKVAMQQASELARETGCNHLIIKRFIELVDGQGATYTAESVVDKPSGCMIGESNGVDEWWYWDEPVYLIEGRPVRRGC